MNLTTLPEISGESKSNTRRLTQPGLTPERPGAPRSAPERPGAPTSAQERPERPGERARRAGATSERPERARRVVVLRRRAALMI